jgi:NTE family protein
MAPDEMHARWRDARRHRLLRVDWRGLLTRGLAAPGIFSGSSFRAFLEWGLPVRSFADLRTPFIAVATDLVTGDPVTLEAGDLLAAVQASCAVPGVYPPVEIGGRQLADGGLSRPVAVDLAVERGAGITIVGLAECRSDRPEPVRGWLRAIARSFTLTTHRSLREPGWLESFAARTRLIVLEPCFRIPIWPRHLFDLDNIDIQVKFGYEYARAALAQEGFSAAPTG